ncbi:MAG: hypothetical protein JRI80_00085 [Deltaproteobacteria bacterium]|nr:hypothetical protein [Deltaproteobacteria bacterium]
MADATAGLQCYRRKGELYGFAVAAAAHLYYGTIVNKNSSGYAKKGANVSGEKALGICETERDNSGGADGAGKAVNVWLDGIFKIQCTGVAITDIGSKVYVVDNQTVQTSAMGSGYVELGEIVGVAATNYADVKINYFA